MTIRILSDVVVSYRGRMTIRNVLLASFAALVLLACGGDDKGSSGGTSGDPSASSSSSGSSGGGATGGDADGGAK